MLSCRLIPLVCLAWGLSSPRFATAQEPTASAEATTPRTESPPPSTSPRIARAMLRRQGGEPAALAQAIQLGRGLTEEDAASLLEETARAHLAAGQLDLAAEARRMLTQRYPQLPQSRSALVWLVRQYASSEVAHVRRRLQTSPGPPVAPASWEAAAEELQRVVALPAALPTNDPDQPLVNYALQLAAAADGLGEPALQFQRAVAARRAGEAKVADELFSRVERQQASRTWAACAAAEDWLAGDRQQPPPLLAVQSVRAAEPPSLDGRLDEACWQGADKATRASLRTAYDDEFLYLAFGGERSQPTTAPTISRPRTVDADLSAYSRVTIELDVDRDYATSFSLTVDERGDPADRCEADGAWNPRWFVAVAQAVDMEPGGGSESWTCEAAVPWRELGRIATPRPGDAWAIGVVAESLGGGAKSPQGAKIPFADSREISLAPRDFHLLVFQ